MEKIFQEVMRAIRVSAEGENKDTVSISIESAIKLAFVLEKIVDLDKEIHRE